MSKGSIPIGRAFGISLRLHYTWFIVFGLVTWALAAAYFPTAHPDWSLTTSITVGVVTSVLFFGSVLAHELAHSVVAQRAGLKIESITLFIFGGVSQITEEPREPAVEFRMALAGPLTSAALGALFSAIRILPGVPPEVAAAALWLGIINLSLAAFNLIPGFPLDGGRVLRSILWWRSRNLRSSTRTASNIGRAVGYLFIFIGIFFIFTGNWLNGLWLAFIGWFLENAAVGSYRQLALQDLLRGHKVKEVMTKDFPCIPPQLPVETLVHDQMLASGKRYFAVCSDGQMRGLVTIHNVKAAPREQWPSLTAENIMTRPDGLKRVTQDDDLSAVMRLLTEEDINQVPVMADGNIVGVVARDNLLSFINLHAELGM